MREIHILFTGVGRRIELIQEFRKAALEKNINLKLYGADMAGTAPALTYCDYTRKVCGMREPDYISELIDICITDKIDLLIPTIDTDLLILSENKDGFEKIGTKVLISNADKIAICRDKNFTADFFRNCGLDAPETFNDYREYKGPYPCFIKPKDGSSSIDAFKVLSYDTLKLYAEKIGDYVIQPFIDGTEYTVDIFCDLNSKPVYIVPRIRLQVRAGEVLKTKICMDDQIVTECKKLVEIFKPVGQITVQLIREKKSGSDYYIEINPRFGGGAPLSMKAGARSAAVLLDILTGDYHENILPKINNGSIYSRFDQSVCIDEGQITQPLKGIIFDLDDTLYPEKDYVRSGYKKIEEYLGRKGCAIRLWEYFTNGEKAIDAYLAEIGCLDEKEKCLEIYRSQVPNISLYDGVIDLLNSLKEKGVKTGIITDGRVKGQRNKIEALNLNSLVDDIIITDELGGVQFRKPNDISYRIMQCRWRIPYEQMMYVGDNADKDFRAPKQLGMRALLFCNVDGLYYKKTNVKKSVNSIYELSEMLHGEI